jgi:signal transduction histidine kinase
MAEEDRLSGAYEAQVRSLNLLLTNRDQQLQVLAEVAAGVHGLDDTKRILDVALESILRGLGLAAGWVFLGDNKEKKLRLAASQGVAQDYLDRIERDGLDECLCPEVFWTGHRMQVRNTTQCPRMPTIVEGLKAPVAHACIPLRFEGRQRGVLNIAARPGEQFSEHELQFLETVGHQICLAIERAEHQREARQAYEDLKAAQDRMVQTEKMALLGTFASGLAHEIRNPLNSMGLQLSILERRLGRDGDLAKEDARRVTGVIREEIQRLDALVGDFLLFSRLTRMSQRPASLEALVREVVDLMAPEAHAVGVVLQHVASDGPLPEIDLDVEKMKQVLINLVRNAIEALGEGGRVSVETGRLDGRVRLAVRDDGPGLPAGLDVFQLFVTTKAQGTGLGLSIAQQIVLQHGGEIRAQSADAGGALFEILLPIGGPAKGEARP